MTNRWSFMANHGAGRSSQPLHRRRKLFMATPCTDLTACVLLLPVQKQKRKGQARLGEEDLEAKAAPPAAAAAATATATASATDDEVSPPPRINAAMAVKGNTLYLLGGTFEIGNRLVTFTDMYALDVVKLNGWVQLHDNDQRTREWLEEESSSSESSEDEEGDD
eukprot:m.90934 g.90934  ORF g.90934 m.90934 type:complete len:165 (+) comp15023_c0_seq1:100-594(+)